MKAGRAASSADQGSLNARDMEFGFSGWPPNRVDVVTRSRLRRLRVVYTEAGSYLVGTLLPNLMAMALLWCKD